MLHNDEIADVCRFLHVTEVIAMEAIYAQLLSLFCERYCSP